MSQSLPAYLKQARLRKGLRQKDVANLLGYESPQFISNWERGVSTPPLKLLSCLSHIYGLSRVDLEAKFIEDYIAKLRNS
ncbi:MAG: helix-turn-helix transcriptional regulator [Pseudomonadota bacterium]